MQAGLCREAEFSLGRGPFSFPEGERKTMLTLCVYDLSVVRYKE